MFLGAEDTRAFLDSERAQLETALKGLQTTS